MLGRIRAGKKKTPANLWRFLTKGVVLSPLGLHLDAQTMQEGPGSCFPAIQVNPGWEPTASCWQLHRQMCRAQERLGKHAGFHVVGPKSRSLNLIPRATGNLKNPDEDLFRLMCASVSDCVCVGGSVVCLGV